MPAAHRHILEMALLLGLWGVLIARADTTPQYWLHRWTVPLEGVWQLSTDGGKIWLPTPLPHASSAPQLRYRRLLRMDSAALHRRWHLHTFGLGDVAEVFLNGDYVGQLISYGLPSTLPIPSRMWRVGTNVVELRVSAIRLPTSFLGPERPTGCFRELTLVGTAPAWLQLGELVTTVTDNGQRGQLSATMTVAGESAAPLAVRCRLLRLRDSAIVAERIVSAERLPHRFTVQLELASPELWSPATPSIYEFRAELLQGTAALDGLALRVGFRSVGLRQTANNKAVVVCNEAPLPLYGVEYCTLPLPSTSDRETQEFARLKALGIASVRVRGVPPHMRWLERCAQAGIAVFVELPVAELPAPLLRHPQMRFLLSSYHRLLAPLLSNPALIGIVVWQGLGHDSSVAAYERELQRWRLSSTVLLAAEVYGGTRGGHPSGLPVVFVRLHEPFVSKGQLAQELATWQRVFHQQAVVPVGGAPVRPGGARGYLVPYSEEAQARWLWEFLELCQRAGTAGAFVWSWQDYTTAYPLVSFAFPTGHRCPTGIIDSAGTPRLAFAALQAFVQEDLEPLLAPGTPSWGDIPLSALLGSLLLIVAGWLLNRNSRLRHHVWRAFARGSLLFTDFRDERFTDHGATVLCAAFIGITLAVVGSDILEWLRMQPAWVVLLWQLLPWRWLQDIVGWWLSHRWARLLGSALLWATLWAVLAAVVALVARLARQRLLWLTAFSALVWAAIPLTLLVPLLFFGQSFATAPGSRTVGIVLLCFCALWSVWRMVRAVQILLRARLSTVVFAIVWGSAIIGGLGFGLYELSSSLSSYVGYVAHLWGIP